MIIMKKNKITRLHIQCFLKYSLRLLFSVLFIISLFYLSLAFETYIQQKQADKFAVQYINFKEEKLNKYIYEKDIYFTPQIATYQTSGSRVYLYISDSIFKQLKLKDLRIEVIRENHGEIKNYEFNYSSHEKREGSFKRQGFHCLAFPAIKLHVDFNNMNFIISGINLPDPDKNLKIMLRFDGIKRRIVLGGFLFKGLLALCGCLLVFISHRFAIRL